MDATIFNGNLVAMEMEKLEVVMNKPIHIGMCVLDIFKTVLYELYYELMMNNVDCKLFYTDTDSLIYDVTSDDIYEIMRQSINRFDTSDYIPNYKFNLPLINKKIPVLMKDECDGRIIKQNLSVYVIKCIVC